MELRRLTVLLVLTGLVFSGPATSASAQDPAAAIPASINKSVPRPKGLVMLIHGGGWRPSNPVYMALMQPAARIYNDAGWSTRIQAEHGGMQSYIDVMRAAVTYKKAIRDRPLCLYGQSSGGQIALLAAASLGKVVSCVITDAAPTWLDLPPDTGDHAYVRSMASSAFGPDSLRPFSPLSYAPQTTAKVFMTYAENDPLIPTWQAQFYAYLKPGTKTVSLPAGSVPWVHSKVSKAAVQAAGRRSLRFLNSIR